jgi:PAS domain S-box-containing protein
MSSAQPSAASPPRTTLLLATSDSATRALLRKALALPSVELVEAADGLEALALARRLDLDLVLLDVFLAVLDGISVCARLRALTDIQQPSIAILGLNSERTMELALAAGADEILTKPFHPPLVRQRVEILLRRRQLEKRLGLLERAVEAAGSGITILDARSSEYPVTYCNRAFLDMTGYSAPEVLGRNLRLLLQGPETDLAASTELRDAFAEGRDCRVLVTNYRKDGLPFWNELSASPVRDAAGRVTHFVATQTDVTARVRALGDAAPGDDALAQKGRELEELSERLEGRLRFVEDVADSLAAGLVATDPEGRVAFANRAALRILGMSLADCVGCPAVELFGNNEEVALVIAEGPPRREKRIDFPFISPGGVRAYVGMTVSRAPEDLASRIDLLFLFRDLAERWGEDTGAAAERAPLLPAPAEAVDHRPLAGPAQCGPADLVAQAIEGVGAPEAIPVELREPLPQVVVDAAQVTEALARMLGNAVHRAGGPQRVRVRLAEILALGDQGVRPESFVRVDVLYGREEITETDFGDEAGGPRRLQHRRADLATAERLLQANGGRLFQSTPQGEERVLTALLPTARAAPRVGRLS